MGEPNKRDQAKARRALMETFVAIIDDDITVTLQTDVQEAVEHLPGDQQHEARQLLLASGLDGRRVSLHELFRTDPDLG